MKYFLLFCLGINLLACDSSIGLKVAPEKSKELPHDFMFMQRAYPSGELKMNARKEAIQWKKEQSQNREVLADIWEFVGPINIGGRVTDIEIPIDDDDTYYVGTASGGIFKTEDAGGTFNPIFDEQEMLSIGDIAISRNNTQTIWVGTGEVNAGGGSLAYDGDGVYASTDGGISWESKGLENVGSIGKIMIDPNNEDVILVGAMGPLFRDDTNRGVYKTTDGGASWQQVLFISDVAGIIDMAQHPTDSDILYAASWHRIRTPNNRIYGGEGSGLWRSFDGGDTWVEMTVGLPSDPDDKGRISIAISESNPNVLYARYADAAGDIQGVYRSSNGGSTWQQRNSNQLTNVGFHWWFRGIFVDPTDENTIYNVDFEVEKSTDGGQNWGGAFPGVHVDQHAMAFGAGGTGEVLLGNDGGLYASADDGLSSSKINTLPITQFYRFHVDAQNDAKVYGGAQDNNTVRTTTGSIDDWTAIYGGDGFQSLVDPLDTNVIYALYQRGNLAKSTNNGASFTTALNGISSGDRKNWDTPIAFDPANSQNLFYGANRLYKTTNAAGNWTAISPDLTGGAQTGNLTFGTITTISVSPINSDIIYVGTDDGNVSITQDGGATWNNISPALPNRWVTSVLADREDTETVYATFSGYRYGEDEGHVYKSDDNGASWETIDANLPDVPVNDILKDRYGNLFIATDIGVFVTGDEGATWQALDENIPSVVVTDMNLHEATEYLYIATYGRSSYKLNIAEDILATNDLSTLAEIVIAPNPVTERIQIKNFEVDGPVVITVFDALGRKIVSEKNTILNGSVEMMVAEIPSGVYYVQVVSGSSRQSQKIIKK